MEETRHSGGGRELSGGVGLDVVECIDKGVIVSSGGGCGCDSCGIDLVTAKVV